MKNLTLIMAWLIALPNSYAQQTGKVNYENLGLSFTIPGDWMGQENEGGFVMGSNTIPGFMMISTNEAKSIAELENEARMGLIEGSTNLQLNGSIEKLSENSIGGEFTGTMEGQMVKAYLIGMSNSKGYGVTILGATTTEAYSEANKNACILLAKSVQFYEAVLPDVAKEWKENLMNARLSYYSSYSSYDYSGAGGGSSTEETIDLCAAGYFNFSSSSSVSVDAGGVSGYSHGNGNGSGTWDVVGNAQGQAVLKLTYYDGSVSEYVITYEDEKTMLNGYRYYRTYGHDSNDGPNCN